jgi:hypothetical protein
MPVTRIVSPKNTTPLEDGTPLVRYIKIPRLLSFLQDELVFTQIDKLRGINDPQEGREIADPVVIDTLIEEYSIHTGEWTDFVEQCPEVKALLGPKPQVGPYPPYVVAQAFHSFIRKRRAVSCWFSNSYESSAMWAAYSAEVAICMELKGLCDALEGAPEIIAAAVRYRDREKNPITLDNYERFPHIGLRPFLVKGREFQHEHEIRFVTRCPVGFEGPTIVKAPGLSRAIKRVIISPYLPKPDTVQLKKLVEDLLHKAQSRSSETDVVYSAINRLEIEHYNSAMSIDRLASECIPDLDKFTL